MQEILEGIKQAALKAGEIILSASDIRSAASQKGNNSNLVTTYDQKVQTYLEQELAALLPEARFLGEENHEDAFKNEYAKGFLFVIDPIDGTSNFIFGYRASVTSIALFKDGRPYMGVVYNPYSDEMFSAVKGEGAWKNGQPIHTSTLPLKKSLVTMGTAPYYADEVIKYAFDTAYAYMPRCVDIRRSGAAALDLCQLASGVLGLFFEPVLQLWDYAAGALIVEEAGGVVTDMEGRPLTYTGQSSILGASQGVAQEDYLPEKLANH